MRRKQQHDWEKKRAKLKADKERVERVRDAQHLARLKSAKADQADYQLKLDAIRANSDKTIAALEEEARVLAPTRAHFGSLQVDLNTAAIEATASLLTQSGSAAPTLVLGRIPGTAANWSSYRTKRGAPSSLISVDWPLLLQLTLNESAAGPAVRAWYESKRFRLDGSAKDGQRIAVAGRYTLNIIWLAIAQATKVYTTCPLVERKRAAKQDDALKWTNAVASAACFYKPESIALVMQAFLGLDITTDGLERSWSNALATRANILVREPTSTLVTPTGPFMPMAIGLSNKPLQIEPAAKGSKERVGIRHRKNCYRFNSGTPCTQSCAFAHICNNCGASSHGAAACAIRSKAGLPK